MKIEKLIKNTAYTLEAYYQTYWIIFIRYKDSENIIVKDIESGSTMSFPIEDISGINTSFKKGDLNINSISNNLFEAVFSKEELKEHYLKLSSEAALIIISNPDNLSFKPLNFFKEELYIDFYDTESNGFYSTIPEEKVVILKEFIFRNLTRKFIVCCEAGISRSAGVAKAIEYITNKEVGGIDSFERYRPNTKIYEELTKS